VINDYMYASAALLGANAFLMTVLSYTEEDRTQGILYAVSAVCSAAMSFEGFMYASSTWH
jgi:hypothetical protein